MSGPSTGARTLSRDYKDVRRHKHVAVGHTSFSGWVGLAEDPSRFSIACRATGPVKITGEIERGKKGEVVFSEDTSILFKEMRVSRFFDADKNVLVYLVWSTKLIDGSPYNSVTAIPITQ